MGKQYKNPKNINKQGEQIDNFPKSKNELSANIEQKIKDALNTLHSKDHKELEKMLGTGDFSEQLRKYFEQEHPSLLDEIESKDKLKIYVEQLKNKGFSIEKIVNNTRSLDESFRESESEYDVTEKSLKRLQEYCETEKNNLPSGIFDDFAKFANIETTPISVHKLSKIKKASDLKKERNKFLETNKINLSETYKKESDEIMSPNYTPTTRLLVSAAIKKIKKNLPKNLQKKYEERFDLPITITSEIQNLNDFKNQRELFLQENQKDIDKDLAKKLDGVRVLNQDMYSEFENEGIAINKGKGFTEQEQAFRSVFNKLATRQLFDDINKQNTIADMKIQNIGEVFKGFPPYVNDIFRKYTYNEGEIKKVDNTFSDDIAKIDEQIQKLEEESKTITNEENKSEYFEKIKTLRAQKNDRKRAGYIKQITAQDPKLGNIVDSLTKNHFDVSKLDKASQQVLLNDLVDNKLSSVINEGTAESLGVDEERFSQLMKDFFDLNQKQIKIPSPNGDIVFDCPEKIFLGGPLAKSMQIGLKGPELADEDKKNLPLNIRLLLTEENKDFFEKSPIFSEMFDTFEAKNGTEILNDSYKVRMKNSKGQLVEGYLSKYPPKGKKGELAEQAFQNRTNTDASRYLYSKPITRPEEDRELVFRDENNGVIIGDEETQNYDIDVISRDLNLNGKGIGALLFGTTVGQYTAENQIDPKQIKKLDESFEKINKETDLYRDTLENKEQTPEEENKADDKKEELDENAEFKKCIEAWKKLGGYQTIENSKNKEGLNVYGFEKGAKLMLPFFEPSLLPPNKDETCGFLTLEITDIDPKKGIFEVKLSGGESKLGGHEGYKQKMPLSAEGIENIEKSFGKKAYKLPKNTDQNPNAMISILEQANINDLNPSLFFKDLERNGKSWVQKTGDKKEEIMYFGKAESSPGEAMDADPVMETMCKVEYTPGKSRPYTVYIIDTKKGDKPTKVKTEMDPINFALFIASKKLSPKTKDEVENKRKEGKEGAGQAMPPKKVSISIANVTSFFKGISKKIGDGLKKYQDKQAEEFSDALMVDGKLMTKLAGLMPSDKLKSAFAGLGDEYLLDRDNKVWKKIEDRVKFYEGDPDFGSDKMRGEKLKPYLNGTIPFKNHWQAAGMLLATTKKGKGPYSRNADRAGKGMWIKILMGKGHQDRYLKMKEKLERELKEGINQNGQQWANDKQNEILKLEMKYLVHVVDGRQLRDDIDTPIAEGLFSKKFAGELEERSNAFFKETSGNVYNNTKDISFELARFEYFRLLGDRPQQAIGNLKAVAEKAVTSSQWKVFESMVLTGMLCGVFNSITQEDKNFIEKICRTTGFLPGLLIRQPNVHHKIAKLLDIATDNQFTKGSLKYNPNNFDFGKIANGGAIKDFANYDKGFNARYMGNETVIKRFLSFEGGNAGGKKLTEIYEDPKTPNDIKQLLGEIISKRYETNESFDNEVKANGKSLQQNILCRNQSLIDEIIKFQDGSFRGKDKDAIEDAKATRKVIKDKIPTDPNQNRNDVIFTLKMFANRFEDKGFNSDQKKFLIRLLKTMKEEIANGNTESAKQMLRYGIAGKIIKSAGTGQVPEELKNGLEAFNSFFENNIDMILREDVIHEGFGENYVDSLKKPAFKVAPWDEYVKVTEYNRFGYSAELSKEENAEQNRKKKIYANDMVYINKTIYDIATRLEKGEYGVPNTLKAMYDPEKETKSTKKQLEEVLGKEAIALKNHRKIEQSQKRKDSPDGLTDEERASMEEGFDYEGGYGDY